MNFDVRGGFKPLEKSVDSFLCRKCAQNMRQTTTGGDIFSMAVWYCENTECERFGDLTLAGIRKKEENESGPKQTA